MNIFKRVVLNWIKEEQDHDRGIKMMAAAQEVEVSRNTINANGFNLRVYKAVGGTIVEVLRSGRLRIDDERGNGLYIITDDKELGEEIGKIITMEGLKA